MKLCIVQQTNFVVCSGEIFWQVQKYFVPLQRKNMIERNVLMTQ